MTDSPSDIALSTPSTGVLLITLTRAEARNALRNQTLAEIASALDQASADESVRCVVITGNDKCFAAGADIKEVQNLTPVSSMQNPRATYWQTLRRFDKPLLAAANGYVLGGGCELLMHCDIAVAGDSAKFGQPEINLGLIPGAGGTQRLLRTVGKPLAMKMVLSGEFISASEALSAGLIAEVTDVAETLPRTLAIAETIAGKSPLAVKTAKQALIAAFETTLESGLQYERQLFAGLMGSADKAEGIAAFLEKRAPEFTGQ